VISLEKLLANRNNAQRSTGPKSKAGKQRVANNALSHGLSVKCEHDENPIYQSLLSMLVDEGYEGDTAQEIALALAEYRRVMDAYYQTYCDIPPLGDFYEMSPDAIMGAMFEFAGCKVSARETIQVANKLITVRNNEHREGTQSMRHGTQMKCFIRYQRKAAAQVGKALRKSDITKPRF
jgi:hypothetical protein